MDSDLSLEIVDVATSKSEVLAAIEPQRDASDGTPVKNDCSNSIPRCSPRIPKPKRFPEQSTPERAFRQVTDAAECPDTAPNSYATPKSMTTSTPITFQGEDDVDTPASPNLEALSSNDSFIAPSSVCQVLRMSPKKTPKKIQPHGTGTTPCKTENMFWPSPYKSHRPKYLPKNVNLVKKKRLERNAFIEKVEKFDAELVKLPSVFASPKRPVNPILTNDGDVLGTQTALYVIFHPDNFFASYNEDTFDSYFDVNIDETVRLVKLNPHLAKEKDLRILTRFLTVTSDPSIFNATSPYVVDFFVNGAYSLNWYDLKRILVNLGLTKVYYEFDTNAYYCTEPPKSPKMWNFEFLFTAIEFSFSTYSKKRLMRLVKFLSDGLFDPILLQCHSNIALLLRQVLEHMVQGGATPGELAAPVNHSYYSWISNRVIVQSLSPSTLLRPLAANVAYRTIHDILGVENNEDSFTLSHIADVLNEVQGMKGTFGMKNIYQLIIICENLVTMAPSPFDVETKTFLGKLADFAEHMSLGYSYFENLFFTDTVTRLRTLSSINSF